MKGQVVAFIFEIPLRLCETEQSLECRVLGSPGRSKGSEIDG